MKASIAAAAAIIIAGTAAGSAADLAVKAPVLSAISNWTGFYVGGHVGAGWGTTESTLDSLAAPGVAPVTAGIPIAQNSRSGFLSGGQVGYNFQSGLAVFGVQADIAGLDVKGTAPCLSTVSCSAKSNWLGTVSGRVGGVVADKTLVYVKGGAAWLNTNHTLNISAFSGGGTAASLSTESTAFGWLLGMGAEYAFTRNWSAFIEYDYMDFDKKSAALNLSVLGAGAPAAIANVSFQNKLSTTKVGVNYKF